MKTAISLPDTTFARAERAAAELRMTRSELYARAVEQYLDDLERDTLTDRIDAAIARGAADAALTADVTTAARRMLAATEDAW